LGNFPFTGAGSRNEEAISANIRTSKRSRELQKGGNS
jgi:hypothetical protein